MTTLSSKQEESLELFRQRLPIGLRHELNDILSMGSSNRKVAALLRAPNPDNASSDRRASLPYSASGII